MATPPLAPGYLGPDMVNTDPQGNVLPTPLPGLDQVRYRDADFWNKAKAAILANRGAIIELQAATVNWPAVFTAMDNVSAFTIYDCTQRAENGYVTLTGSMSVTPVTSGPASFSVPPPVAPLGDAAGVASVIDIGSSVVSTASAFLYGAALIVVFDAASSGQHILGFSITYKAA